MSSIDHFSGDHVEVESEVGVTTLARYECYINLLLAKKFMPNYQFISPGGQTTNFKLS